MITVSLSVDRYQNQKHCPGNDIHLVPKTSQHIQLLLCCKNWNEFYLLDHFDQVKCCSKDVRHSASNPSVHLQSDV